MSMLSQWVQERQQVKDHQSYISVFVIYLTCTSRSQEHQPRHDSKAVFQRRPYVGFIEIKHNLRRKKIHRANRGSNFLGGNCSNRESVRAPIQLRRERRVPASKKMAFLQEQTHPFSHQQHQSQQTGQTKQVEFSSIEIKKPFPVPVYNVSQARFKFRCKHQLLPQIRCLTTFRENVVLSGQITTLQITSFSSFLVVMITLFLQAIFVLGLVSYVCDLNLQLLINSPYVELNGLYHHH